MQTKRTPHDAKRAQTLQAQMRQMWQRHDLNICRRIAIYSLLPRVLLAVSWVAAGSPATRDGRPYYKSFCVSKTPFRQPDGPLSFFQTRKYKVSQVHQRYSREVVQ